MTPEQQVTERAARQRGLIHREQALAAGMTSRQIGRRLQDHRWLRKRPSVYVIAGTPASWEGEVAAVLLSAGDGAVASHATAGRLLGALRGEPEAIEVTTTRAVRLRLPGVRAHQTTVLFDADRRTRSAIATTSAARFVVDMSTRFGARELGSVVDDLQRRRLLTLPGLAVCAARLRRAPGRSLVAVDALLRARWDGFDPGDSDLETRVLVALAAAGLPLPRQQFRVAIGGRRYYLDLAYPEIKLAIEVDSWVFHRSRTAFDGDRARGNDLVLLGWQVLRVTDRMSDSEMVAVIAQALERLRHPATA